MRHERHQAHLAQLSERQRDLCVCESESEWAATFCCSHNCNLSRRNEARQVDLLERQFAEGRERDRAKVLCDVKGSVRGGGGGVIMLMRRA